VCKIVGAIREQCPQFDLTAVDDLRTIDYADDATGRSYSPLRYIPASGEFHAIKAQSTRTACFREPRQQLIKHRRPNFSARCSRGKKSGRAPTCNVVHTMVYQSAPTVLVCFQNERDFQFVPTRRCSKPRLDRAFRKSCPKYPPKPRSSRARSPWVCPNQRLDRCFKPIPDRHPHRQMRRLFHNRML